jgi:hypothetical protein
MAPGTDWNERPRTDPWAKWRRWGLEHPDEERVARRFRHHIRTPRNPKGRIHREACQFCPNPRPAQAHHVDYSEPYKVVWCCDCCHRDIEAGAIKVLKKHVWDYTSLIARPLKAAWRNGPRKPRRKLAVVEEPAPF